MDNQKNMEQGGIPVFTPPTPTFTPPKEPAYNGPVCHYHPNEPAVTRCSRCGKPLCQDCQDSYGFTSGEYANQTLCYDCTQEIASADKAELEANYSQIKSLFVLTIVGVVIGAIIGIVNMVSSLSGGADGSDIGMGLLITLLFAAVGGCFLNYVKNVFSTIPNWFTSTGNIVISLCLFFAKMFFYLIVEAVKAVFVTLGKVIRYSAYMSRTKHIIEDNDRALRSLSDYMEYTLVRSQNRGVDIETLLKENSQLADNTVVQMARTQTEEQIEANMRNCVASINENGEIIRSFAA